MPGANGYYNAANGDMANGASQTYPIANQGMPHQDQGQYQSEQPFYPDPQTTTMPPYASASLQAYNNAPYSDADMKPNIEAQLNAGLTYANPQTQATSSTFNAHGQPAQNGYRSTQPQGGPTDWRDFTQVVMHNMPSGANYAQTLMALQNPSSHVAKDSAPDVHPTANLPMAALGGLQQLPPQHDGGQPWPLIHYGNPNANASGQ